MTSPNPVPTRTETDSMGPVAVPADALYGASTQRAVEIFTVSGRPVPAEIIHAYGHLKAACARVNHELGLLDEARSEAIARAALEIAQGRHDRHFPVDVYQTGSGTSTNMNVNEVVANLVRSAGGPAVHPNDHVNLGQSSNDTFPTAVHMAAALAIRGRLLPALGSVAASLERRAREWDPVVKIGRTHLQDATPIRLGQEFSGYAHQMRQAEARTRQALHELFEAAHRRHGRRHRPEHPPVVRAPGHGTAGRHRWKSTSAPRPTASRRSMPGTRSFRPRGT